ncbi:alkaline ceramidase Ydc1p [Monosporozyma unispora]|nr:hypothetical protein C6P44_000640 [Kazachstania unispora]
MGFLRWAYPEAAPSGYWGPTTALIDWCEENYVVSHYIAEWSNTLSNIMFLITASYSTYCSYRNDLEFRFILIGLMFALVGVGSWLFHMTLKFRFQLLDELPMVYATSIPAWSIFSEFNWHTWRVDGKQPSKNKQIGIFIAVFSFTTILTYLYLVYHIVILFQVLYGILTVTVVLISGSNVYYIKSNDPLVKKNIYTTMGLGIITFAIGFIFWQLDQLFCPIWIHIRRDYLKLPLGVLFEMHGWWHLLTGLGVYTYLVLLHYLRIFNLGKADQFSFIWRWGVIPEIINNDLAITNKYSLTFWGPYETENYIHKQQSQVNPQTSHTHNQ